jgi:TonB family protein
VPEHASPAEVEQIWRALVLKQQQVLVSERQAALDGPVQYAEAPGGSSGSGGSGSGQAGGGGRLVARVGGRIVSNSRVVTAPMLHKQPRTTCDTIVGGESLVIRFLVAREGGVRDAYIKRASGDRAFDLCALGFVQRFRFDPGLDAAGLALDVWMNALVSTAPCPAGDCGERIHVAQ